MKKQKNSVEEYTLFVCTALILLFSIIALQKASSSIESATGQVISRANISSPLPAPCNITLNPGLNLISFYCILLETPMEPIVANITGLEAIYEYQENSVDPWKSYNPSLPSWVIQDLEIMSRREGYWVRVSGSPNFMLDGYLRVPTEVSLVSGWNLAGYPTNATKNVSQSFQTIQGNFTEARAYDSANQVFLSHIPPSTGGLVQTVAYQAFWINATTTKVWVIE